MPPKFFSFNSVKKWCCRSMKKKLLTSVDQKLKILSAAVYGNMFNVLSNIQNREKWPARNGKSFSNYEKTHHTKIFCISVTYVHLLFTYFIIYILKYKIYLMICCTEMSNIFLIILANLQFHEIFGTKIKLLFFNFWNKKNFVKLLLQSTNLC